MTLSLPLDLIEVLNRPDLDRYTVAALSGTGNGALQFQLVLATTQHLNAFTNVDLPLVPPALGLFENPQFILYLSQGPNNFVQQIGASPIQTLRLVPEPGTLMLVGLSSFGLLAARFRIRGWPSRA
jgi:PEP-CTERM motif